MFFVGFFIGAVFGVFIAAILSANAESDRHAEDLNREEFMRHE